MEPITLIISPFLVSLLTQWIKNIPKPPDVVGDSIYISIVRLLVAALSLGAAIGTQWLGGADVSLLSLQTFADAFIIFVGATGIYFFSKQQK